MLQIEVPDASRAYIRTPFFTRMDYGPLSSTLKRTINLSGFFLLGFLNVVKQYKGWIADGDLSSWGDRPCNHYFYDGSVIVDPNLEAFSLVGFDWRYRLRGTTQYAEFLIGYGCDLVSDLVTYYSVNSNDPKYIQVRWLQTDRYLYVISWEPPTIGGKQDLYGKGNVLVWCYTLDTALHYCSNPAVLGVGQMTRLQFLDYKPIPNYRTPVKTNGIGKSGIATDIAGVTASVSAFASRIRPEDSYDKLISQDEKAVLGGLAQRAVESVRYTDTNGLQFFAELRLAPQALTALVPKGISAKAFASAYLASQYAVATQLRDVDTYVAGLKRRIKADEKSRRVCHSSAHIELGQGKIIVDYHYKIIYDYYDSRVLNLLRILDEWSLRPTITMAWDLVPFSFVIDWFTNLGSLFETMDYNARSNLYNVYGVTRSKKVVKTLESYEIPSFGQGVAGTIKYTTYTRSLGNHLDLPVFNYSLPDEFNNTVELTALIVANKKH